MKRVILNILVGLSVLLVLLAAASTYFFSEGDAFLLGYKPFLISSESMEPTYRKYATVLVRQVPYEDVRVGDAIAFRADQIGGKIAFHRVIEITPNGFVTQGDANNKADSQIVDQETFVGREAWGTNLTATLIPLLQTPRGVFMIVVLPIVLIILIVAFFRVIRRMDKEH